MAAGSPFLNPSPASAEATLALIALSRQSTVPAILRRPDATDPTDQITNTRFGSFPHATLIDIPWGSQVRASNVNARERKRGKKRKRAAGDNAEDEERDTPLEVGDVPAFEAASSGFAHLLYPTPETWTYSLPHRTQVVYTPDYSYILQRLQVRPGSVIIEAGAGSGSFTHAAARAVFDGFPLATQKAPENGSRRIERHPRGRVLSFEYHQPRFEKLKQEVEEHGLGSVVHVTQRDVYKDGFLPGLNGEILDTLTVRTDAIFLDLPAPWIALPHLTRNEPSILNPTTTTRICTFSPCIEQVQRTITALREHGWLEIDMVEIAQKRIDVRRERIGLHEEGLRGVLATPASVDEALDRLRENEAKQAQYHDHQRELAAAEKRRRTAKKEGQDGSEDADTGDAEATDMKQGTVSKRERLDRIQEGLKERKPYKEGTVVHRTEPEVKTHTSYLVFALLPLAWSEEDERRCIEKWDSTANK